MGDAPSMAIDRRAPDMQDLLFIGLMLALYALTLALIAMLSRLERTR